jgi:hypothetical protein
MEWDQTVQMIEATVQVENTRPGGDRRISTGLLVQAPWPDGTPRTVLVTAAHAVDPSETPEIRIGWRFATSDGGWRFAPQPAPLEIGGRDLWARHPDRDIAVVQVVVPPEFADAAIPLSWLGDERDLDVQGVGPGDQVFTLGYPRGLSANRAGFPILRTVRIASWPLSPIRAFPTFLVDGFLYPGNSGGPVFLENGPGGYPLVLGIVTQQVDQGAEPIGLGVVVHAAYIRETLAVLDQQAGFLPPARRAA